MLGDNWTDDDGIPLGEWVVIEAKEAWAIKDAAGDALRVFSSLTDPDGNYGTPTIYTAWGVDGEDVPRLDARDSAPTTWRKFIPRDLAPRAIGDSDHG